MTLYLAKIRSVTCKRAKPIYKPLIKPACKPRLAGDLKLASNRLRVCCYVAKLSMCKCSKPA